MSAPDCMLRGKLRKAADMAGTEAKVGVASTTIRKHFGNLQHFLKHMKGRGFKIGEWTFEGLLPRSPNPKMFVTSSTSQRRKTSCRFSQVSYIYELVGSPAGKRRKPGKHVFYDSFYYLPILFTYLGPRRNEFATLHVNDIARSEDGYVVILQSTHRLRSRVMQPNGCLSL